MPAVLCTDLQFSRIAERECITPTRIRQPQALAAYTFKGNSILEASGPPVSYLVSQSQSNTGLESPSRRRGHALVIAWVLIQNPQPGPNSPRCQGYTRLVN